MNPTHRSQSPFADVPATPQQHFVLNLFAAVHHLLHLLRRTGASSFESFLERYPFLSGYLEVLGTELPEEVTWTATSDWWQRSLTVWERDVPAHLPLRALAEELSLGFPARMGLLLAGLIEDDSRFGTLFAELQRPLVHRRPTLELVCRAVGSVPEAAPDPWTLSRDLVDNGLVLSADPDAPRSEWPLRVPTELWRALRGEPCSEPFAHCRHRPADEFPHPSELLCDPSTVRRISALPGTLGSGSARFVVFRCDPGTDATEVLGSVAGQLGRGVLEIDTPGAMPPNAVTALGPLATVLCAMPVLRYQPGPGDKVEPPELAGYRGPVALVLGAEGGVTDRVSESSVTLEMPFPRAELRREIWRRALNGRPLADLDAATDRYHLSSRFIRRLAHSASTVAGLDGRSEITLADLRRAGKELGRHLLDNLAERLECRGDWEDLAVIPATSEQLSSLERRCRHRERVLDHLGAAFANGSNRGVRALFTGPSGTGKTLAAKILASRLEMDLYRVDLAAIVNKYIGETEKNLQQILARAEALDVVLLLDEGDSLLGGRTQVKSATDRYANLETNYLLQRLEHYQGIILVTTNLGDNIDRAFQRRMDVVVPFLRPGTEERWRILELHLPGSHEVDPALLDLVALRCDLTGGQLRNVAMQASLLALDDNQPVGDSHLELAIRAEYKKAGGTFPLEEPPVEARTGDEVMGAFVSALASR